jgi:hypothetical protein
LAELMPIAITVAGKNAPAFAQALAQHGADVEIFTAQTQPGFDLAVLLAEAAAPDAATPARISGLAAVSERLLFVPAEGAAPNTDAWFEVLAESGYQPVVDYDAGFLGQGAFLVDRNATAAEEELAAFADRLAGVAPAAEPPSPPPEDGRAALQAALTTQHAAFEAARLAAAAATAHEAALQAKLEAAEALAEALRRDAESWRGLRLWVEKNVARASLNSISALRGATGAPRGRWWWRLLRLGRKPTPEEARILADLATLRACPLFDAPWYIASNPTVAQSGIDPVLHYLLSGAAGGADPGPWFDTAAYRARHPGMQGNPLLHAIAAHEVPGLLSVARGQ